MKNSKSSSSVKFTFFSGILFALLLATAGGASAACPKTVDMVARGITYKYKLTDDVAGNPDKLSQALNALKKIRDGDGYMEVPGVAPTNGTMPWEVASDVWIARGMSQQDQSTKPWIDMFQCQLDSLKGKTVTTSIPGNQREKDRDRKPKSQGGEDDHAPLIVGQCIRIKQAGTGVGDAYKRIYNDCAVPVAVQFCLEAPGAINECLNRNRYGLSDVIRPHKSQLTADAIEGPWTAWFFTCDMSNPKKQACIVPQDIAGSGVQRR